MANKEHEKAFMDILDVFAKANLDLMEIHRLLWRFNLLVEEKPHELVTVLQDIRAKDK